MLMANELPGAGPTDMPHGGPHDRRWRPCYITPSPTWPLGLGAFQDRNEWQVGHCACLVMFAFNPIQSLEF